jgi:hypothetical protein
MALACASASASPITWTLQNFNFTDGGTASGSFVFDANLGQYSQINVVTTMGNVLAGATYSFTTAFTSPSLVDFGSVSPLLINSTFLSFIPLSPLTDAGGTVNIAPQNQLTGIEGVCVTAEPCGEVGALRGLKAGASIVSSTSVPEPGAMALLSLGLLGLLARKKLVR